MRSLNEQHCGSFAHDKAAGVCDARGIMHSLFNTPTTFTHTHAYIPLHHGNTHLIVQPVQQQCVQQAPCSCPLRPQHSLPARLDSSLCRSSKLGGRRAAKGREGEARCHAHTTCTTLQIVPGSECGSSNSASSIKTCSQL